MVESLDEITSDLSVFHGIENPLSLPCSRFFRLAEMLPAYDGAVRNRLLSEARRAAAAGSPGEMLEYAAAPGVDASTLAMLSEQGGGGDFPGFDYEG